jgi:hypothetical protein
MATNEYGRQVRQYHNLQRRNALFRAYIGAKLRLERPVTADSLAEAAVMVGSSPTYIAAMVTVLSADDPDGLLWDVLLGSIPLLEAAKSVRKRAKLLQAYRASDAIDREALGEIEGVDKIKGRNGPYGARRSVMRCLMRPV